MDNVNIEDYEGLACNYRESVYNAEQSYISELFEENKSNAQIEKLKNDALNKKQEFFGIVNEQLRKKYASFTRIEIANEIAETVELKIDYSDIDDTMWTHDYDWKKYVREYESLARMFKEVYDHGFSKGWNSGVLSQ